VATKEGGARDRIWVRVIGRTEIKNQHKAKRLISTDQVLQNETRTHQTPLKDIVCIPQNAAVPPVSPYSFTIPPGLAQSTIERQLTSHISHTPEVGMPRTAVGSVPQEIMRGRDKKMGRMGHVVGSVRASARMGV
jgi:hypothetical protein